MKSIGISIKNTGDNSGMPVSDSSIQLHLNLWKPTPKFIWSRELFYLDIGIKARFITRDIKIYLPFELDENNAWKDLAHIITNNKPVLRALFNEDYNINQISGGCYYRISVNDSSSTNPSPEFLGFCWLLGVKQFFICMKRVIEKMKCISTSKDNDSKTFYIYTLGDDNVKINKCCDTDGLILSVNIPNQEGIGNKEYYYIRFRVAIKNYRDLVLQTDLSNNLIQSAFTKLDMYNIQINEKRDIPYGPKGVLTSSNFSMATFSEVHILYLSNPKVTVENGSLIKSDRRLIESNKWKNYIPESYPTDTYIAHHWKISPKGSSVLDKINLFFTARYPRIQTLTIIIYLSVVIILGCLGSLLASLFVENNTLLFNRWRLFGVGFMVFYILVWYIYTHYCFIFKIERKSTVNKIVSGRKLFFDL